MGHQGVLTAESVPPRSLLLRAPVWGIDPSTLRWSLAVLGPREWLEVPRAPPALAWRTCSLPRKGRNEAVWFGESLGMLLPWLRDLVLSFGAPALVLVEEPFAYGQKHVHPSSNRMLGVGLAALGHALGVGSEVELVGPSSWKALAMGAGCGGAKPAQYLEWARAVAGYDGVLEDEAAAVGIATAAGVRLAARQEGSAA